MEKGESPSHVEPEPQKTLLVNSNYLETIGDNVETSVWKLETVTGVHNSEEFITRREELNKSVHKIRCLYEILRARLSFLEDLVSYPPRLRTPPGTNLIAGEIWFATYAVAEHCRMNDCSTSTSSTKSVLRSHFQRSVQPVCQIASQLKIIHENHLKLSTQLPITVQSIIEIVHDPVLKDLAGTTGRHLSVSEAARLAKLNDVHASSDQISIEGDFTSTTDSLANRQNREIFLRTAQSKAWINFRKFPGPEREGIITDILAVAEARCQRLLKHMKKFTKSLVSSKCFFFHQFHLVVYLEEWKSNIVKLMKLKGCSPQDRLDLEQVALDIRESFLFIFQSVETLYHQILELCDVTYLSFLYLRTEYKFRIKKCNKLEKYSKKYNEKYARQTLTLNFFHHEEDEMGFLENESKNPRDKGKDSRNDQDEAFYSKYYPVIHRKNAVTIADLQLILLLKISIAVRHSMADFEGPRYLNLDQRQHIWLSNTRYSLTGSQRQSL